MAGWSDWYSGDMAPPMKTPGGYAPAPSMPTPMSVEEMYRGIYGPSAPGLTTRTVQTVPPPISVMTAAGAGLGTGMRGAGDVTYTAPRVVQGNPLPGVRDLGSPQYGIPGTGGGTLSPAGLPPGSTTKKSFDERLNPEISFGGGGKPFLGAGGFGSGALTPKMPEPKVLQLDFNAMSDVAGQNTANSAGRPVRYQDGKTYYPSDMHTDKIRPPMKPVGDGGRNGVGTETGGGKGLGLLGLLGTLGGLFGGNGGAGLLGGLGLGSASPITDIGGGGAWVDSSTGSVMPAATNTTRYHTGY